MGHIFISYSRQDREIVDRFVESCAKRALEPGLTVKI